MKARAALLGHMLDIHRLGREHLGVDDDSRGAKRQRQAQLVARDAMAGDGQETGVSCRLDKSIARQIDGRVFHQGYERDAQVHASWSRAS
ncbi:hypothetical protein GCM10019060_20880 [Novosphingobium pokkalii]|nr:hypothetical protein GCM10019060_20880 [Novosphingobium pokkalii]